jgi:hypothetical protein
LSRAADLNQEEARMSSDDVHYEVMLAAPIEV